MGAEVPLVRLHYLSTGRSRTGNAVTEDRGPSGLKGEEILEKTPFPLLPTYIIFGGLLTRLKKVFQNKLHNKFSRRDMMGL